LTLGGGAWALSTGKEGGGRKSLKVLKVEVKAFFQRVLAIFLLNLYLKLIASEEKMRTISVLGINNDRSAAVRGGGARRVRTHTPGRRSLTRRKTKSYSQCICIFCFKN